MKWALEWFNYGVNLNTLFKAFSDIFLLKKITLLYLGFIWKRFAKRRAIVTISEPSFSAPDEDRLMQSLYNVDHVCKWENTVSSCATIACHEKSHCHLVHQHSLSLLLWWKEIAIRDWALFSGIDWRELHLHDGYPFARYRLELWPIFCRCLLPLSPFDIV